MRAKGYRLVQMWLPDTRTDAFATRARDEASALAAHPNNADDQAFVDAVSWFASEDGASLALAEPTTDWWRVPDPGP